MPASAHGSFRHDGGPVAVLLIHGFTGSPKSMRPWAEYLAAHDLTVRLPLLPGHATTWQELNRTPWDDWYATVASELADLRSRHEKVFICGLSMGGALALRLAEEQPSSVAGLVLVNPAVHTERLDRFLLPLVRNLIPSFPGISNDIKKPGQDEGAYDRLPVRASYTLTALWGAVKRDISRVSAPLLLLRSTEDHVVEPSNAAWIIEHIASVDKSETLLANSYHVATLDNDAPQIFAESLAFIRSHAGD